MICEMQFVSLIEFLIDTSIGWLQRLAGEEGVQLQLVKASQQEAQQREEEARQARLDAIRDAAGVRSLPCCLPCLLLLTSGCKLLPVQLLQRHFGS